MKRYGIRADGDSIELFESETGAFVAFDEARALELALSAERTRREAAEKLVNWVIRRPEIYDGTDAYDLAVVYRAKYPRDPK